MNYDPTVIDLLANQVLNCVCAALEVTATDVEGQPGCPCRAMVVPGTTAHDMCCGGGCDHDNDTHGELTVQVVRTYRSSNFPAVDSSADCKAATIAVELLVSLVRCAPAPNDRGFPPTPEALTTAATIVNTDMYTVMQAVLCCVPDDPRRTKRRRIAILEQRTIEPSSCIGSTLRFVADLNDPCGCRPEEVS